MRGRLIKRRLFLLSVLIVSTYILLVVFPTWMFQGGIFTHRQESINDWHSAVEGISTEELGLIKLPNVEDIKIFYNRIPKCGSRAVLSVLGTLGRQRHYNVVAAERGMGRNYFWFFKDEKNFVETFQGYETPLLYSRHIHFVNFTQHGKDSPVYINVIRQPLDRYISHYFYNKFGTKESPRPKPLPKYNTTLDQCVQEERPVCLHDGSIINTIIPFFCGHGAQYMKRSFSLLQKAKDVISRHYLLVGVMEDIPGFFEVLEAILPRLFHNATVIYQSYESQLRRKFQTARKYDLKESTLRRLRQELAYEYDLYYFVKQRFYDVLNKIRVAKAKQFGCKSKLFPGW